MTREKARQWERIPVAIPVFLRGVNDRGNQFLEFTSLLNISNGGALLAVRNRLPPESAVTLEIPAAPRPESAAMPRSERMFEGRLVRLAYLNGSAVWGLKFSAPLTGQAKAPATAAVRRGKRTNGALATSKPLKKA